MINRCLFLMACLQTLSASAAVVLDGQPGEWRLLKDGQVFFVQGAGGSASWSELRAIGANAVRTWSADGIERDLDLASKNELVLLCGFWLPHECHGFDYSDTRALDRIEKSVLDTVRQIKGHKALLAYALGNEMERDNAHLAEMWTFIDRIAEKVKVIDPDHPVCTVVAEIPPETLKGFASCRHLDFLGVNSYGGASTLGERWRKAGMTKPYLLTEYGARGAWEGPRNSVGSPLEQTSTEKAQMYAVAARSVQSDRGHFALGSFAFYWGAKVESTSSWHGLLLESGERTAAVEALQETWGRMPVTNHCPKISPVKTSGSILSESCGTLTAWCEASDPENDRLSWRWTLVDEVPDRADVGEGLPKPKDYPSAILSGQGTSTVVVKTPGGGNYRLSVTVFDGKGNAACANVPVHAPGNAPFMKTKPIALPAWVYADGERGRWQPTGLMGDVKALSMDLRCRESPYRGNACIKVTAGKDCKWAGCFWQDPANDWGEKPGGCNLSGATALSFRVRGARGGERITFFLGGLQDKRYSDTCKAELKDVLLSREWTECRIPLAGRDLTRIKSGFGFVLAGTGREVSFSLDDIVYIGERPVRSVPTAVRQSERDIPIAARADIVVVGGTSAAVAAALAARKTGASVYLVAPFTYLGEDLAGTLELRRPADVDMEHPVARALWEGDEAPLKFGYRCEPNLTGQDDGTFLTDGLSDNPDFRTLDFAAQRAKVSVVLDSPLQVTSVDLVAFKKRNEYDIRDPLLAYTTDGKAWKTQRMFNVMSYAAQRRFVYRADLNRTVRGLAVVAGRPEGARSIRFGEIVVRTANERRTPRTPTPLEVKSALDELLIAGGIDYMTGAIVTDVLKDRNGQAAGVVMANRAGRQAVTARGVIDATTRGTALVAGGGRLHPLGRGATFSRVVASSVKPSGNGLEVEELPDTLTAYLDHNPRNLPRDRTARFYRTIFRADAETDDPSTWADIEMRGRVMSRTTGEVDASDVVRSLPRTVADDVPGLLFVGATYDYARVEMRTRKFLARAAADIDTAEVRGESGGSSEYEVCERLEGLRSFKSSKGRIVSVGTSLPVFGEYDVVVVGGGTAGAPAAIGAARTGARTLVVEYMHRLGGIGTVGGIGYYWYGNVCGFTKEVENGIAAMGWDVKGRAKAEWWRKECRKAGADVWFGAMGCGAVKRDGAVVGVVVATGSGRGVVLAKRVIDATGAADVAAACGERTEFVGAGELAVQGAGMPPKRPGYTYANSDWGYVNDSDALDLWLFALRGRRGAKGEWDIVPMADSRERRRMIGSFVVNPLDVINERKFRDTIAQGQTDFDTHGPTVADICFVSEPTGRHLYRLNIPFRALLPSRTRNLAVVGIGASAHRDAMPFMRMQADVQNEGYAAGYAAAVSIADGVALADVDIRKVQRHLVEKGVVPREVLDWEDDGAFDDAALSAAVATVGERYRGIDVVMSAPDRALPLLRAAHAKTKDDAARLRYAHVLGILGDAAGAETLAEELRKPMAARHYANPENKAAFGRRMDETSSWIVALGRTRSPLAREILRTEIRAVSASTTCGRARAIDLACEALRDSALAPELAAALGRPGVGGHAKAGLAAATPQGGFGFKGEPQACDRELHLVRALWLCGDCDGLARRTLEAYAEDPRGIYAAHARALLDTFNPKGGKQ